MNEKHLTWARAHDWGRTARLDKGRIAIDRVEGEPAHGWGIESGDQLIFDSFENLKTWAGY